LEVADEFSNSLEEIIDHREPKASDPLNSELGFHRILRTSPLTEVPSICCKSDCE
jgi:hypothetical protein